MKTPVKLPRRWPIQRRGIVAECDIRPTPRGRLYAKVLIFKSRNDLLRFTHKSMGRWAHPSRDWTCACVQLLCRWRERLDRGRWTRRMTATDPRYFCVVSLCRGHLNMRIISHEAVHVGFCYAKRVKRTPWAAARDFDEEEIAYPAGEFARLLNAFLHKRGLYPKGS